MTKHPNELDANGRELLERNRREREEQERHAYLLSSPAAVRLSEASAEMIGDANLSESQQVALAESWNAEQTGEPAEHVALAAGDPTDELAAGWREQTGQ